MQFSVEGSIVRLDSGAVRDFGRRVQRIVDTGSLLVVLLDPDDGSTVSENVFALDSNAQVVWRVQEFEFPNGRTPYTQISRGDDGSIKAYNFSGIMAVLDPTSGRVIRSYVAK